ncbi:hypothetical protein FOZ63_029817, partial [Perkinsus olseni]
DALGPATGLGGDPSPGGPGWAARATPSSYGQEIASSATDTNEGEMWLRAASDRKSRDARRREEIIKSAPYCFAGPREEAQGRSEICDNNCPHGPSHASNGQLANFETQQQ